LPSYWFNITEFNSKQQTKSNEIFCFRSECTPSAWARQRSAAGRQSAFRVCTLNENKTLRNLCPPAYLTANRAVFDQNKLSAADRAFPTGVRAFPTAMRGIPTVMCGKTSDYRELPTGVRAFPTVMREKNSGVRENYTRVVYLSFGIVGDLHRFAVFNF